MSQDPTSPHALVSIDRFELYLAFEVRESTTGLVVFRSRSPHRAVSDLLETIGTDASDDPFPFSPLALNEAIDALARLSSFLIDDSGAPRNPQHTIDAAKAIRNLLEPKTTNSEVFNNCLYHLDRIIDPPTGHE